MHTVIVVNGMPRAGKDSAVNSMMHTLAREEVSAAVFSSVDPIREMLRGAGFDLSRKTAPDRALLATLANAVEEHSNARSRWCAEKAVRLFMGPGSRPTGAVMFLHIREPDVILRVRDSLRMFWPSARFVTVLLRSIRSEEPRTDADRRVEEMTYDRTINNDGTLEDLAHTCERLLVSLDLASPRILLA